MKRIPCLEYDGLLIAQDILRRLWQPGAQSSSHSKSYIRLNIILPFATAVKLVS
jgi:hypothetical protein